MNGRPVRVLGLTGGIGSGKSTVAERFSDCGAIVLDADAISRGALSVGGGCYFDVVDAFGAVILNDCGEIHRKKLAQIVFASTLEREKLNRLIHPFVHETMRRETETALSTDPHALVVWDVPLLFESGFDTETDAAAVVVCDTETRIDRVMRRSNGAETRESVLCRIHAQMSDKERIARADYVLNNNGSLHALYAAVDALYARLTGENT